MPDHPPPLQQASFPVRKDGPMRSIIIPNADMIDALRSTDHLTDDELAFLAQLICVRLRSRNLVALSKLVAKASEQLALGLASPSMKEGGQ